MKIAWARENAGDQVVISLSLASYWSRKWREFSGLIKEQSKQISDYFKTLNWKFIYDAQ